MARTAIVIAPAQAANPTLEVYNPATNGIVETITLVESPVPGKYFGTATAPPGNYHAVFKSGSDVLGTFADFRVLAADPSNAIAADSVHSIQIPRYDEAYTEQNQAGDFHTVTKKEI